MKNKCRDCCHPKMTGCNDCGCCDGIEPLTPLSTVNRPGLSQLSYRIGTYATFLETMKAGLSAASCPALSGLTTREGFDPSIALLDAWATIADVLTFYQERIANEGYLRTATERRSIVELARLVGYRLRPGVASSVSLAYTVDEHTEETTIPAGSRAQSVPGPDELPQSFETSEELKAKASWNSLRPRMTRPQTSKSILNGPSALKRVYLKGVNTNLKPNDPLLVDLGNNKPVFYCALEVKPDAAADHTLVTFQLPAPSGAANAAAGLANEDIAASSSKTHENFDVQLIKNLTLSPSLQPGNSLQMKRDSRDQFAVKAEAGYMAAGAFTPVLRETLARAVARAETSSDVDIKVYALRLEANLFGYNVPKRTRIKKSGEVEIIGDWPIIEDRQIIGVVRGASSAGSSERHEHEEENVIYLASRHNTILADSWVVVERQKNRLTPDPSTLVVRPKKIDRAMSRSEYGITAPTTRVELEEKWISLTGQTPSMATYDDFNAIRSTTVYAQSEQLELAEEPVKERVCGGVDQPLELDGFYEGLESGRWVIVSGERDIPGTSGIRFSELAMLSSVEHRKNFPGDKIHTFIKFFENLAYCFKRDTVTIYGNVVKATHGETRKEVLGSGDGSRPLQSFGLRQAPLTHASASNTSGVDSTLEVFVNDVRWHEADSLAGLKKSDRKFVARTDNEDKTTILFGNGREGARLPTGVENIRVRYRNGIGRPGNVRAEQITMLATKPLGVKEVINPLRASGGADRESVELARKSAPLAVKALDRLVSVRDYEDFSRIYGGIGKARATEISDGRRQLVHVTIAGADDIPIDETSDLFRNLRQALHNFGDSFQPLLLSVRELMLIFIQAGIRILPDYQWEPVVTSLRKALLDKFSFERRELGQDVLLSEAISVMQAVRGVDYVDVDILGGIPEKKEDMGERRLLSPEEITGTVRSITNSNTAGPEPRLHVNLAGRNRGKERELIHPAQLAYLTPDVPDTLILNQIR